MISPSAQHLVSLTPGNYHKPSLSQNNHQEQLGALCFSLPTKPPASAYQTHPLKASCWSFEP